MARRNTEPGKVEFESQMWLEGNYLEKSRATSTRLARLREILTEYIAHSDKRVLSIGCGDCAEFWGLEGCRLVGLDYSEAALKRAKILRKKGFFQAELVKGDALDLPFKKDEFDLVVIGDVMDHMPQPERLVGEAHRVLKKNGLLFISNLNVGSLAAVLYLALGSLPAPYFIDGTHVSHFTIRRIRHLLTERFIIEKTFGTEIDTTYDHLGAEGTGWGYFFKNRIRLGKLLGRLLPRFSNDIICVARKK